MSQRTDNQSQYEKKYTLKMTLLELEWDLY